MKIKRFDQSHENRHSCEMAQLQRKYNAKDNPDKTQNYSYYSGARRIGEPVRVRGTLKHKRLRRGDFVAAFCVAET
jgi:hypothetical protein